ncbi:DUF4112 domain-containing protein [Leisingera sp. S132]|uniref:DUF4112 domain-containing protein n=1 Tax=Leisingera sp. S132 TaxID=2867016 RepID=UPI0021A2F9EC|nr:DUF4112 domain-containing protein [Leisingera sp. S132]UWQ80749.1 DUF4112 domain-containing protein [Leisingera sp. S132]
MPELPSHQKEELLTLERLAQRMDRAFRVPLLGVRVGWDSIAGLVPGVGDVLALAPAVYILFRGFRMGASAPVLARMAANIGIDTLIGSIPLAGDLFDVAWKANTRNIALLRRHLEENGIKGEPLPKRLGKRKFSSLTAPRELRLSPAWAGNQSSQRKPPGVRRHPLGRPM